MESISFGAQLNNDVKKKTKEMGIAGGIAWGRMSFYNGFSFRMSTKGILCRESKSE
jgi:hypothetical protein